MRSSSLIPAYKINEASVEDLSLEAMMGTPFTCEKAKPGPGLETSLTADLHSLTPALVVSETKCEGIAKEGTQMEGSDANKAELLSPGDAACDTPKLVMDGLDTKKEVKDVEVKVIEITICLLHRITIHIARKEYSKLMSATTPHTDLQADNAATSADDLEQCFGALVITGPLSDADEIVSAPVNGLPCCAGQHLRFDDDGSTHPSPRQRVYLRGVPEPVGKHTRFE